MLGRGEGGGIPLRFGLNGISNKHCLLTFLAIIFLRTQDIRFGI